MSRTRSRCGPSSRNGRAASVRMSRRSPRERAALPPGCAARRFRAARARRESETGFDGLPVPPTLACSLAPPRTASLCRHRHSDAAGYDQRGSVYIVAVVGLPRRRCVPVASNGVRPPRWTRQRGGHLILPARRLYAPTNASSAVSPTLLRCETTARARSRRTTRLWPSFRAAHPVRAHSARPIFRAAWPPCLAA